MLRRSRQVEQRAGFAIGHHGPYRYDPDGGKIPLCLANFFQGASVVVPDAKKKLELGIVLAGVSSNRLSQTVVPPEPASGWKPAPYRATTEREWFPAAVPPGVPTRSNTRPSPREPRTRLANSK